MASAPIPTLPRRRSLAGPIILILVGVLFLLGNAHVITWSNLGLWFAHYWPLLLILWGAIKLVEHLLARHGGYQESGIGFGGTFLVFMIIICGITATGLSKVNWPKPDTWPTGDWWPWGTKYDFHNEVEQTVASHGTFRLAIHRGSITVLPSTDEKVHVSTHKTIEAGSKEEAEEIDKKTLPQIKVDEIPMPVIPKVRGLSEEERSRIQEEVARARDEVAKAKNQIAQAKAAAEEARKQGEKARAEAERFREEIVNVNVEHPSGTFTETDMEIRVPPTLPLELSTDRGNIEVRGRQADVKLTTARGDVSLEDVTGNANVTVRHGDFSAHNIKGDVTFEGRVNDTSVSDVSGMVVFNGESLGEVTLQSLGQGLHFTTSRTDLQTGKVEGDLRMDLHDLRASHINGGFRVATRSKQITLEDVAGNIDVNNRNASVELRASKPPTGNIVIANRDGGIEVSLPAPSPFQVEASTRWGEIRSDFPELTVQTSPSHEAIANGSVGKGGKKIQLTTEHADIDIRKADQDSSDEDNQKPQKSKR